MSTRRRERIENAILDPARCATVAALRNVRSLAALFPDEAAA